jgi:hypothetical protein
MDKVALLPSSERAELFQETGARRGVSPAIIEKDFWVCWVLKHMFSSEELKPHLVFKGGTSLSKVFGLIDRFSEDVDLILDWRLLGYGPKEDPYQDQPSNTKQNRFNQEFNTRAQVYIRETLLPQLEALCCVCPEVSLAISDKDPQAVLVTYPAAFSLAYLRPIVLLEIGPLASYVPNIEATIQPYAAEEFPKVFDDPDCPVIAIEAERTFWEKATILHQQAHQPRDMPRRHSRHYYDMYCLAGSKHKAAALADLDLLQDVVEFKSKFYRCPWAKYKLATPGTFKLIPKDKHLPALKRDYQAMGEMIFGKSPSFEDILDKLQELEDQINALQPVAIRS